VNPADGESSHCTGVRALSRLIRRIAARTASGSCPATMAAPKWFTDSTSRKSSTEANGKFAMPISSPW
jgi:hypothetical protein